jgi:uroporphyrinogen decarboxylase
MEYMSRKERLLTAYANKIPDRVPATPDISNMVPCRLTGKPFWQIYLNQDPPLWRAYIEAIKYFGIDGRFLYGDPRYQTNSQTADTQEIIDKKPDRWLVRKKITTPAGDLTRVTTYMRGDPPTDTEKLIKDFRSDFPKIRYLFPEVVGFDPSFMNIQKKELGDLGIMITGVSAPGFQQFAGLFEGNLEAATYAYYDHRDLFDELVDLADRQAVQKARYAIEAGTEVIQTGGSGSLTMASPELWREMSLPTIKKITRMCKEAGVLSCIHSCGKEQYLVETCYHETDLDSVNPLETPPMGDCNLADIKRRFGDKLSLQGNLHTTAVMLFGSPDDVRLAALIAIRDAGINGGFILSTGDQCGRDTPDANLFAFVNTAKQYGQYPLDLESIDAEIRRLSAKN